MTTTVSVERAMAEAKEVQERGIVGIYPLSLVALAAEVESLRKAGHPAAPAVNVSLPTPANVRQGWSREEVLPFYGPAYTADQMEAYARAVLAAAIPPGHCVVPVEPTPAMSEAGQNAHYEAEKKIKAPGAFEQGGFARRSVRASYVFKAMIAARPGGERE